jgi:sugar phosphate isomerase/epimerase
VRKLRLTDPDPGVRRQALEFAAAIVDLAGSFNAPAIIGSMQGRYESGVSREVAFEWLAEAVEPLALRARDHGVSLLIEPLNRYETNLLNTVADALRLIDGLRAQNVHVLGDLFHMNIEEQSIPQALLLAGSKLGHVHFADTNRQAIGSGHLEMAEIKAALIHLGYNGAVSAEILPLPDSESAAAQTINSYRTCFAELQTGRRVVS